MPQEATGQYLLMAYLDLVMRQLGGDLFTEVNSGEGRLDILLAHQGTRYVIETKIWRGKVAYEDGRILPTSMMGRRFMSIWLVWDIFLKGKGRGVKLCVPMASSAVKLSVHTY